MTKKSKTILPDTVVVFVTADRMAIKALGILGLGHRGLSVEEVLDLTRAKRKGVRQLPRHFTRKWFQQALTEGFTEQTLWLKR